VLPLVSVTVPATAVVPAFSAIALLVTPTALTGPPNCTWMTAFTGTPAAPFGGVTSVTAGAVVCGPAPVVKEV